MENWIKKREVITLEQKCSSQPGNSYLGVWTCSCQGGGYNRYRLLVNAPGVAPASTDLGISAGWHSRATECVTVGDFGWLQI